MSESAFFHDLAVLMAVAGFAAIVFARLGWPKVLGYLGAGILMSSHTWGGSFLKDPNSISTIGGLGVVFLMFSMGLSFSPREMRRIRFVAMPAAIIDTIVMIWLGYIVGTKVFGWSAVQSVFLGVAICDSATTLLAKVIDELGWTKCPFTKYVLGTSICEDIVCVGAIAVATGFAKGGGMSAGALAGSLGALGVFFLAVLVFGFILVPRLLTSIGKRRDDEALVLAVLGTCFFISFIAYLFDFSLALGAFLVGILCGTSDIRERIASLVDPLKSMFAAVFFVSIGLLVNPNALLDNLSAILLVSAVVIVGKFFNITFASLLTGVDVKTAVQNGFSLAQIGEFAFMVAILYAGLMNDAGNPMFQIAVGVSLLTTLLNPLMIRISEPAGAFVERLLPESLRSLLSNYSGWLEKIGSSSNAPALKLLKVAAIRLGVYAVLIVAVAIVCAQASRFDFTAFWGLFEDYDCVVFYLLANVFAAAMLPMILSAARALADEVVELLANDNASSRWLIALRNLVHSVVVLAVLFGFFVEWSMINVTIAPKVAYLEWISLGVILVVGICGWSFFRKAGRRATQRFKEALTAEERRDGLVNTLTVTVPEGTIHRFTLEASSPAIGATVVTLNIRAKTGASIVSVYRNGEITRNIGPEWEFAVGDTLVALGEQHQIAALKDLLGIIQ